MSLKLVCLVHLYVFKSLNIKYRSILLFHLFLQCEKKYKIFIYLLLNSTFNKSSLINHQKTKNDQGIVWKIILPSPNSDCVLCMSGISRCFWRLLWDGSLAFSCPWLLKAMEHKWTQREWTGYLDRWFDNCVYRVGKLSLTKCPSSNEGKVHPGRHSSCLSSTDCLNEAMEPSVAWRRCSEQTQAAIVLQQEKEGIVPMLDDGGFHFEGCVFLSEALNTMVFKLKLKNTWLKNVILSLYIEKGS